jgi:hypothetical protein
MIKFIELSGCMRKENFLVKISKHRLITETRKQLLVTDDLILFSAIIRVRSHDCVA